jgi:hypothetical protein
MIDGKYGVHMKYAIGDVMFSTWILGLSNCIHYSIFLLEVQIMVPTFALRILLL